MRLHLTLFTPRNALPFAYQHELVRSFHRHLPNNTIHDDISLYSLSWLRGGIMVNNELVFPSGALWDVSFYDDDLAKEFLVGIVKDKDIAFGMTVSDVIILDTPPFGSKERLLLQSPILLKHTYDGKVRHIIFNEPEANDIMTSAMKSKLIRAGLEPEISLRFDTEYTNAKTKLVDIKGVKNRASFCPVIAEGTPETLAFAWSVGLGHSTGTGFGAVL